MTILHLGLIILSFFAAYGLRSMLIDMRKLGWLP
jgi:hypothetical protein